MKLKSHCITPQTNLVFNQDDKYFKLKKLQSKNIIFLGSIFDRYELNLFRNNAIASFHGHSVGGTNPSLLEAMASGNPIFAHKNEFNISVLSNYGFYFKGSDDLSKKIITEFVNEYEKLSSLSRETLEPLIKSLIDKHKTNFKGVGQPLRIALVGSRFGPGLYDVILSLDKAEVLNRLKQI